MERLALEDLKARVDVRDLARHLGIRVKRGGKVAHCPGSGHRNGDRTPSLQLFPDGWTCHSTNCDAKGGDCFSLVEFVRGVPFKDALAEVAAFAGADPATFWGDRREDSGTAMYHEPEATPQGRLNAMMALNRIVSGRFDDAKPLRPACFTMEAIEWLESRGLDPEVAHDLGCRDWWPCLGEIRDLVRSIPKESRPVTGLVDDEGRGWWPLRELGRGNDEFRGLAVPVWVPGFSFPVAWRWRLYQPVRIQDRLLKCLAMARPVRDWMEPPLGLPLSSADRPDTVFIVEGEPDWLAFNEVLAGRADVFGMCKTAEGWREHFTRYLRHYRRVFLCTHEPTKDRLYPQLAEAYSRWFLWDSVPRDERVADHLARRLFVRLFPEGDDANDHHQRGELAPLVDEWLGAEVAA